MQTLRSSSIKPEPQSDIPSSALVVDDSGVQRKILSASLVRWGFQVYSVSSCAEALEVCQTNPPDLVICEWMMPNMNGLEFCQAFRAIPRENYGYFILVSSRSEKIEVMRGLEIGVDDFLTKPMNASELQGALRPGNVSLTCIGLLPSRILWLLIRWRNCGQCMTRLIKICCRHAKFNRH